MLRRLHYQDRRVLLKVSLRLLRTKCRAAGHEDHAETITKALQSDDVLDLFALDLIAKTEPDELVLADEDGPLLAFIKYLLEHPEEAMALLVKILALFGL